MIDDSWILPTVMCVIMYVYHNKPSFRTVCFKSIYMVSQVAIMHSERFKSKPLAQLTVFIVLSSGCLKFSLKQWVSCFCWSLFSNYCVKGQFQCDWGHFLQCFSENSLPLFSSCCEIYYNMLFFPFSQWTVSIICWNRITISLDLWATVILACILHFVLLQIDGCLYLIRPEVHAGIWM